jgi:hypothetical protein
VLFPSPLSFRRVWGSLFDTAAWLMKKIKTCEGMLAELDPKGARRGAFLSEKRDTSPAAPLADMRRATPSMEDWIEILRAEDHLNSVHSRWRDELPDPLETGIVSGRFQIVMLSELFKVNAEIATMKAETERITAELERNAALQLDLAQMKELLQRGKVATELASVRAQVDAAKRENARLEAAGEQRQTKIGLLLSFAIEQGYTARPPEGVLENRDKLSDFIRTQYVSAIAGGRISAN